MCKVSINCLWQFSIAWSHGSAASSAEFQVKKGWVKVCVCNSCPEVHGSGVFRQNSGGQQSGCLGTASSRLKRLETTLTLTHPSLADTGRTSLLICKHAPPWSTSKAFACRKPLLLASFGEIAIRGKKNCPARKRGLYAGTFLPSRCRRLRLGGINWTAPEACIHFL